MLVIIYVRMKPTMWIIVQAEYYADDFRQKEKKYISSLFVFIEFDLSIPSRVVVLEHSFPICHV